MGFSFFDSGCFFVDQEFLFFCLDYSRVNNLLEFVNLWFQKKQTIKSILSLHVFCLLRDSFLLSWYKRNKKSSLQIKSLKTTLKFRSAPRAVRPADSTRGVLPLHFFVVFYAFYLRANLRAVFLVLLCFVLLGITAFNWSHSLRPTLKFLPWFSDV